MLPDACWNSLLFLLELFEFDVAGLRWILLDFG